MHALYRLGSVEKFVLSVVEYDAPGKVIAALCQHMVRGWNCFLFLFISFLVSYLALILAKH